MNKILSMISALFLAGAIGAPAANNVERKVLLEYFSTAYCGGCPEMTAKWAEIAKETPNLIWVTHHAGFTYDNFTIKESKDYEWFYESGKFAPGSMLDRTSMARYGGDLVSYPMNKSTFKYYVTVCGKVSPKVSLAIDRSFDASTRQLTVNVSGAALETLPDSRRLTVYLTEDSIVGAQYFSSTGEYDTAYIHSHVLRAVLSNTWGDEFTIDADKFSKSYTVTIPDSYKPERMHIVAFVSNYDPDDKTNCNVFNAEIADVVPEYSTVHDVRVDAPFGVSVQDGRIIVSGTYDSFEILNIKGEKVSMVTSGNIYIVRVNTGSAVVARKIVVR